MKTFYKQPDTMDCGPTCLRMIHFVAACGGAKHYGRSISLEKLRSISETTRAGSSLQGISLAAEQIGFRTMGVKIDFNNLEENAPLPCVVFWNERHFNFVACFAGVVVYKIKTNTVYVADPAHGLLTYSKAEFIANWIGAHATEQTEDYLIFKSSLTGISRPLLIDIRTSKVTENLAFSILCIVIFAIFAISANSCWLKLRSSRTFLRWTPKSCKSSRFFTTSKIGIEILFLDTHVYLKEFFMYLKPRKIHFLKKPLANTGVFREKNKKKGSAGTPPLYTAAKQLFSRTVHLRNQYTQECPNLGVKVEIFLEGVKNINFKHFSYEKFKINIRCF